MNRVERCCLLGLLPILATTRNMWYAAVGVGAVVLVAAIVALLERSGVRNLRDQLRLLILLTVALAVGRFTAAVAPLMVPLPTGAELYVTVAALSPIALSPARREAAAGERVGDLGAFAGVMLGLGAFREVLGLGTILGYELVSLYRVPAGLLAEPAGAFLMAGVLILGARAWSAHVECRVAADAGAQASGSLAGGTASGAAGGGGSSAGGRRA